MTTTTTTMTRFQQIIEKNKAIRSSRRKITNTIMLSVTGVLTILALVPLFWIIGYVIYKGGQYINNQDLAVTLVEQATPTIKEMETKFGCFFEPLARNTASAMSTNERQITSKNCFPNGCPSAVRRATEMSSIITSPRT